MLAKRKLSVADVLAMAEAGLFAPDERVELLDGEIYTMTPPSSQHAAWVDRVMKALERAYGDRVIVRVQSPIALTEHSSPEPDVSVLAFRDDFYEAALPTASQVLLAVEVAWSSLGYDRDIKLPLYAAAGVPEVWIVNVDARQLEVYRDPRGAHYRTRLLLNLGEAVAPVAVPDAGAVTF
jgi:Uma2 family endonuclease